MKEATGELSMTGIAIAAVAVLGVLFINFIYPNIRDSLQHNQECSAAYGCHDCDGNVCLCYSEEHPAGDLQCPDSGAGTGATVTEDDEG